MPIAICSCQCGSTDQLIRGFLQSVKYKDWLNVPIEKGKERSRAMLNYLPSCPEKEMLDNFLRNASKWAVIVGYNQDSMKWSDIAHNGPKSRIEAEFVINAFAN